MTEQGLTQRERDLLSLRYSLDGEVIRPYSEIEDTLKLEKNKGYHIRCGAMRRLDTWVKKRHKGGEMSMEQERDLARFMGAYLDYARFERARPSPRSSCRAQEKPKAGPKPAPPTEEVYAPLLMGGEAYGVTEFPEWAQDPLNWMFRDPDGPEVLSGTDLTKNPASQIEKNATRKPRDIKDDKRIKGVDVTNPDDCPLRYTDLSDRSKQLLRRLGYATIGDIRRATDDELREQGVGEKALEGIRVAIPYSGE